MPKHRTAHPPHDVTAERQVRGLAHSSHAPAGWIRRARMITRSWQGLRTALIAQQLQCHQQTVRERPSASDARGLDGLGDRPGAGRKRRIAKTERRTLVALVALPPPGPAGSQAGWEPGPAGRGPRGGTGPLDLGCLDRGGAPAGHPDGSQPGAAHPTGRGHPLAPDPLLGDQDGSRLRPKRTAVVALYIDPPANGTSICTDELGPVTPRLHAPPPG